MICYKDRTFCYSNCTNKNCYRFFGEEEKEGARKWWSHDPDNAPIAFSDFSATCEAYQR
jgi:hypothetical protein